MNCERASLLAAPDHRGKSLSPTLTPPRTDLSKNAPINTLFSSIWQKSAQVIDSMDFQVLLFCDTCALFGWKPSVFSMLTKTPPIMNVHVVESGKWRVTRREEKGSSHSRSLPPRRAGTSVRKQRDRVRDDNSRKVARGGRGTIGNFGRDRGGRLAAFGVYDSLGRRGEPRVTIRGFGASELYQALRSVEQTGDVYVG
jgi:hypothetical protein